MSSLICPKCGGPRPPWQGYCYECVRKYRRAKYRKDREEAGFEVYGMDEIEADEELEAERTRKIEAMEYDIVNGVIVPWDDGPTV
jgi:hypothetical protein